MSDTAGVTPAPGSVTNPGGSGSPVNAQSSASQANQQAAGAGENQGLSNKDQASAVPDTPPATAAPATPEPVSVTPAATATPKAVQATGNVAIDQIQTLLSNAGFEGVDTIIGEMVETNELSLASKAKMVKELGADVAQLAINQLESSVQAVAEAGRAEGARLKEYAFQRIGGESADSTWTAIQQAVHSDTALKPEDKAAFNSMLQVGGPTAEIAIDSLVARYKDSGGYIQPNMMQGDMGTSDGFKPLGKREYQQEIGPLVHKHGESSPEVQALRQRRQISMSRGYN